MSRGLRVLPSTSSSGGSVKAERDALVKEIAQIEQWWRDARWKGTKRTYSGTFCLYGYTCLHAHILSVHASCPRLNTCFPNAALLILLFVLAFISITHYSHRSGIFTSIHFGSSIGDYVTQMFVLQCLFEEAVLIANHVACKWRIFSYVWSFGSRAGCADGSS